MDPRDTSRHDADLDWLYGEERPSVDKTEVMDATELAELERRRAMATGTAATTGAQAARAAHGADDPEASPLPRRVVHTEAELAKQTRMEQPRPASSEDPWQSPRAQRRPVPAPRPAPPAAAPTQPAAAATTTKGGRRTSTPPPPPPRPPKAPRVPRRRPPFLRLLLLALLAWLVWLLVVPLYAMTTANKVDEQPDGERPGKQPGTTTLLVGSDARESLSSEEQAKLGTGTETGQRTDTMMLLYTPRTGKPVLVSLPRDSYVSVPGHGHNKLNAAYSLGGPQLLVQTIEQDTGLRIDNYLEIGFGGFAQVVDALGGIQMCLDKPMVDKDSHTNLPAGCQKLKGTQALGYVRMRKADPEGDIGRTRRQREMTGAIVKKATSPMTFVNPVRYWKLNMAMAHAVRRGEDTSLLDLGRAGGAMRQVSSGDGLTLVVPLSSVDATTAAGSSVLWDDERAREMFSTMASGSTEGLEKYAK